LIDRNNALRPYNDQIVKTWLLYDIKIGEIVSTGAMMMDEEYLFFI